MRATGYPAVYCALLAVALAAGCDGEDADPTFEVDVTVSELIPTVVTLHGSAPDAITAAYVDVGLDETYGQRYEAEVLGDGEFSVVMLGLLPSTEYLARAAADTAETTYYHEGVTFSTGPSPAGLPTLAVDVDEPERTASGFFVTSLLTDPTAAVILDDQGNYVWWYQSDPDSENWPITRARISVDGESVLFLRNVPLGSEITDDGQHVMRISLDGSQVETIETPGVHNDLLELSDGTLAVMVEDSREVDGVDVVGDRLVEISLDGTWTEIWNVWDHLEYDPEVEDMGHWTHANAIDFDEEQQVYYVGARHVHAIFEIDRASGELLWTLGGPESDFELDTGGTEFSQFQHQFEILDDGILIFDNRDEVVNSSRVVEYALDEASWTATRTWQYVPDPQVYCYGMGDVHRLPSGNTLVTWSSAGMIDEVTPNWELVWRSKMELGSGIGYLTHHERLPGMAE